jgi:hypothetical protein
MIISLQFIHVLSDANAKQKIAHRVVITKLKKKISPSFPKIIQLSCVCLGILSGQPINSCIAGNISMLRFIIAQDNLNWQGFLFF